MLPVIVFSFFNLLFSKFVGNEDFFCIIFQKKLEILKITIILNKTTGARVIINLLDTVPRTLGPCTAKYWSYANNSGCGWLTLIKSIFLDSSQVYTYSKWCVEKNFKILMRREKYA